MQLEGDGPDGEATFLAIIEALKANAYARLKGFDGRSRLSTYLAIAARDILADRLTRGFVEATAKSWKRFERFFGQDIRRRVVQRFPRDSGTGRRDDIYREICSNSSRTNIGASAPMTGSAALPGSSSRSPIGS